MKRVPLAMLLLLGAGAVQAMPPYARFYKEKYGVLPSCIVCHQSKDWRMTGYGEDFQKNGRDLAAMSAIEGKDSDGDGAKNIDEIRAQSNPGDPASTPKRLGDWLKDAKIMAPAKPMARAFPGAAVDVSLPVWTDDQRKALAGEGDEALYPVVFTAKSSDGKTAGRAVYVSYDLPGVAEGDNMLLVMADASGAVAGLRFIHHHGNKDVKQEAFLDGFKGRTLDALGDGPAAPAGAEKDAKALAGGVRKALVILKEAAR